jgi:hypothetical protein
MILVAWWIESTRKRRLTGFVSYAEAVFWLARWWVRGEIRGIRLAHTPIRGLS